MSTTTAVPAGYTVGPRERVTWVTSHPYQVQVNEPDGNVRSFDTRRQAMAWLSDPDNVMPAGE